MLQNFIIILFDFVNYASIFFYYAHQFNTIFTILNNVSNYIYGQYSMMLLVEDDEHRRFPRPRFVRTLRFLFCWADFGAFSTSEIDVDSSSRSDPEVVSTNEVDSGAGTISPESPPPSAMINAHATCFLINAHMFYTRLCWHNSL